MTATTKEILGQFSSLYEGVTTAIPRPRDYREADRDRLFHLVLTELPSLLADSERLAAIEAVTGEEVKAMVGQCRFQARFESLDPEYERFMLSVADALISLSAKVAEQAEEIERLWIAMKTGAAALRRAQEMHDAAADERDALSTIRVQMEGGNVS